MQVPGWQLLLDADALPWRATASPGVEWLLLASEAEPAGAGPRPGPDSGASVLIRMAPGRGYPPHRHRGVEEVLVLQGGYRDERGTHRAGAYLRYPAGSAHAPVAVGDPERPAGPDNPPCVLFASARGGIELLGADPPEHG